MELLVLVLLAIVLAPIIFGLAVAVASIIFSGFVISGGFFFFVANEVAHDRMPPFMLLFALGLSLITIPLLIFLIRGLVRGSKFLARETKIKLDEVSARGAAGKAPKKSKKSPKTAAKTAPKKPVVLITIIGFGLVCVISSVAISALSKQPFRQALLGSFWLERTEQKSENFNASAIQKITVNVHNEPITVRTDESATEVTVRYNDIPNRKAISVSLDNGNLNIREERTYRWASFAFFAERTEIEIIIPTNFKTAYDLKTSSGRIIVNSVIASSLQAKTSNGSIELPYVMADKVDAQTSNGRIILSALNSSDVTLKTSNGRIEGSVASNANDFNLNLRTSNGHITLNGERLGTSHTSTGADFTFGATTSNGDINLTFGD